MPPMRWRVQGGPMHKTKLCRAWLFGRCPRAASECRFAHGELDRRDPWRVLVDRSPWEPLPPHLTVLGPRYDRL